MRQKMMIMAFAILLVAFGTNCVLAQTKCPPKRSFFKEKKQRGPLVKFPELKKERTVKDASKAKPEKQRIAKTGAEKEKSPDYRVERVKTVKVKMRKVKAGNYASTKCPH